MSHDRFVITRPDVDSGLGANLLSMVGALYLCERSGRNLIVDWTKMDALRDKQANYFVSFFELLRVWRGVQIFYVNDDDPSLDIRYEADQVFPLGTAHMPDALAGKFDHRYLYLEAYHYNRVFDHCPWVTPPECLHYTKQFYGALTPRSELRKRLASFRPLFEGKVVIGLNVRAGNAHPTWARGGVYENRVRQAIFDREDFVERAYRACLDCVATLPRHVWLPFAVYVVTDTATMQQRLLKMPGAFAVRKRFPPSGVSLNFSDFDPREYGDYSDIDSINETIVDMFLLAECQGLVCNYTEYNRYAQYMTMFYNGNIRNLESFFDNPIRVLGRHAVKWAQRWNWMRSESMP